MVIHLEEVVVYDACLHGVNNPGLGVGVRVVKRCG